MNDEFKQGDEVVWSSHGKDHTPGVVVRKIVTYTLEKALKAQGLRLRQRRESCCDKFSA